MSNEYIDSTRMVFTSAARSYLVLFRHSFPHLHPFELGDSSERLGLRKPFGIIDETKSKEARLN